MHVIPHFTLFHSESFFHCDVQLYFFTVKEMKYFFFRLVRFFTQLSTVPQNSRESMNRATLGKNPWIRLYYWIKYKLELLFYLLSIICCRLFTQ